MDRRPTGRGPIAASRRGAAGLAALALVIGVVLALAGSTGAGASPATGAVAAQEPSTTVAPTSTTAPATTEATTTTAAPDAAAVDDGASDDGGDYDGVLFALEALVVVGAIVMGTRSSGIGLGIWGGVGTAILVFIFGLDPGSPPIDAILIILSVILAAATMQVAGGIDWMVAMAAKAIMSRPKQVTLLAPLMSFVFCLGAGTGNIVYPLLPVIYDVSYKAKVRPERPLSMTVVASGIALAASPVSAAMAAMITLTDVEPYNFTMIEVLAVTIPAALIGIFLTSLIVRRLGSDLEDDPEYQARLADGRLSADSVSSAGDELTYTKQGRNAAFIFLAGVLAIIIFGLFPDIRPQITGEEGLEPLGVTPIIQMVMFVAAALMLLICKPQVKEVPESSVFKAGIVSAVALFGLAWLTDTFIGAWETQIVDTVGGWVTDYKSIFFIGVFLVAALTTSQSTATRTIVPIGLAAGLSPAMVSAMWAGGFAGVFTLPTNGSQIAAANFDATGTTKLGTKLLDHSFIIPVLLLGILTAIPGMVIATLF